MELEHEAHDRAVAAISHLPHAAASALCLMVLVRVTMFWPDLLLVDSEILPE
jgi:prephenate dehydrogenase